MKYPSRVDICSYGNCLVATSFLPKGVVIQKLEGPITSWNLVSEQEICYAILIGYNNWMIIQTDARYINHSCDPNCVIDNELRLVTVRRVKEGEELTISYNIVYEGEDPGFWDPRWSFKCCCGAKNCQGIIDKYITINGNPWYPGIYEIRKKAYIVENPAIVIKPLV
jgi:hypothetical protein